MINWVEWALLQFEDELNEIEVPVGEHASVRYSGVSEDGGGSDSSVKSVLELLASDELADFALEGIRQADDARGTDVELGSEVKNLVSDDVSSTSYDNSGKRNGKVSSWIEGGQSATTESGNKSHSVDLQMLAQKYEQIGDGSVMNWMTDMGEVAVVQRNIYGADADEAGTSTIGVTSSEVLDGENQSGNWLEVMGKTRQAVEQLQIPKTKVEMESLGAVATSGGSGFTPWQLDKVVQRDARRYDSGFSLY